MKEGFVNSFDRGYRRGKRGDRMGADQYDGYLPDQLWSLPDDTGRSATIILCLQFFDDGIAHRLSTLFCNLSAFTVHQNHGVAEVRSLDISVCLVTRLWYRHLSLFSD
jgi:hypothetical protein